MKPFLLLFLLGLFSCKFEPLSYSGTILDAETGKPVVGAAVVLRRSGNDITQTASDSAGKFRVSYTRLEDSIILSAKGYRKQVDVYSWFHANQGRPVTIWMRCRCQHDEQAIVGK